MSDLPRDTVLNYRPGPQSELPVEPGEPVLAVFAADRRRYWTDAAAMAGLGIAAVVLVLPVLGKAAQIPVGILGVVAAVAARSAWLASEVFARRWQLTNRRLVGPQGRQVMLLEIARMRRLMGDVQVVTKDGQKHLIKHLADPQAAIDRIETARAERARVVEAGE